MKRGSEKYGSNDISVFTGDCGFKMVYLSPGSYGGTSVLRRIRHRIARFRHNTKVSGQGVDENIRY